MKLQFKATRSHRNHYDNWNVLKDGEVGEYPDDIGKEKLQDFPNNFTELKPKREKVKEVKQDESAAEKAPDKSMKSKRTKIKRW